MYMFHGGTNFGFMNGSILLNGEYQPTVTSYDYGAPLNEAGDRTETYYAVRALFERAVGNLPETTATESKKAAYGEVRLTHKAELFQNLSNLTKASLKKPNPVFMEDLGQGYGYVLYRSEAFFVKVDKELTLLDLKDRATVYANGKKLGVQERGRALPPLRLKGNPDEPSVRLEILVENMGRNNFGPYMFEKKGLGAVLKAEKSVFGWESVSLDLENTENLTFEEDVRPSDLPTFYKAEFEIDEPRDTFLKTTGLTKGFAIINGFNLGRYYNTAGPQQTLYVPATVLKKGKNKLIVFESDEMRNSTVEFLASPERSK
jgi:beta-galactosidase